MNEQELAAELSEARQEIAHLRRRLDALDAEPPATRLPDTMLLDHSFLKRAFAILGHYLVAALIISIPFYLLFFLIAILFGGFWQGI